MWKFEPDEINLAHKDVLSLACSHTLFMFDNGVQLFLMISQKKKINYDSEGSYAGPNKLVERLVYVS